MATLLYPANSLSQRTLEQSLQLFDQRLTHKHDPILIASYLQPARQRPYDAVLQSFEAEMLLEFVLRRINTVNGASGSVLHNKNFVGYSANMMITQQSATAAVEAHEAWFAAKVLAALEDYYAVEPVTEPVRELVETH